MYINFCAPTTRKDAKWCVGQYIGERGEHWSHPHLREKECRRRGRSRQILQRIKNNDQSIFRVYTSRLNDEME